jgi:hypothetical protein
MSTRTSNRLPLLLAGAGIAVLGGLLWAFTWSAADAVPLALPAAEGHAAAGHAAPSAAADGGDERHELTPRLGCLGAPAGSTFRYRITDRSDFTVLSAEAGSHPGGRLHAEGFVTTTVLDRRDGEVLVQQQIDGLQFFGADGRPIGDDPVAECLGAAAATPVLVRLDARGKVLGFAFDGALDGDQRNFLRGTLGVLLFQAPAADARPWNVTDSDTTGDYEARYEVLAAAAADELCVRRTRRRYTMVAGHAEPPVHELRGTGEATFSLRLGWLGAARLDEGMTIALPMLDLQAVTERRATVQLLANGHVVLPTDFAADWARATAPATGAGETTGRFAADSERRAWQQRLDGVTLDQLLAELMQLLGRPDVDAEAVDQTFQKLQWLARLDRDVVDSIGERIGTRQLQGELAGVALSSLGAAGTDAAQSVLAAVRSDRSLAADVRQAATISALQLDHPSAELTAGLVRDASSDGDGRGNAMLVLGALAPRSRGALADGRSAIDTLLAMEDDAAARGDLSTWLLAVGNAAPPQTVQIVQRHLGNQDPSVRASACVALRRVADPVVVTILVERGLGDAVAIVRREAMGVLGSRSEAAARAALQDAATNDADEELRHKARTLLQSRG